MHPTDDLRWAGSNDYPDPTDESVDVVLLCCGYFSIVTAWISVEQFNEHRRDDLLEVDNEGTVIRHDEGWYCDECDRKHRYDIALARSVCE
jgi:hypothetical protein